MRIGILDNSVTEQVLSLLLKHPLVEEIETNDDWFSIQCRDIHSLVEWMEDEHGLYLIAGGGGWRLASAIDEEVDIDKAVKKIEGMDPSEIDREVEERDIEDDTEVAAAVEHAKTSAIAKAKEVGLDLGSEDGKEMLKMLMKKELDSK